MSIRKISTGLEFHDDLIGNKKVKPVKTNLRIVIEDPYGVLA